MPSWNKVLLALKEASERVRARDGFACTRPDEEAVKLQKRLAMYGRADTVYRAAMEEIGADTSWIDAVLAVVSQHGFGRAILHPAIPEPARRFMQSTQSVINSAQPHLLAAAFCYGRELLVPNLFRGLLDQLRLHQLHAPILPWYFERHIALDGDSHGPLAEQMVTELCGGRSAAMREVDLVRNRVVRERDLFWESIAEALQPDGLG